jgi:predicted alpha/beta-fold hydrolase
VYQRQRFSTPDGDFVDIDFLNSTTGFTRGIVLLYHGLESNTHAPLTVRQAFALAEAGFDVAGLGFWV